jgi:hypothetical protein
MAETSARSRALSSLGARPGIAGVDLIGHYLDRRRRSLGLKVLSVLRSVPAIPDALVLARWLNVVLAGHAEELLDRGGSDAAGPSSDGFPPVITEVFREGVGRSMDALDDQGPDRFGTIRSHFEHRPALSDVLAETAQGPEAAPAAVALSVLAQVDAERALRLAGQALSAESRPWLIDEVARAITGRDAQADRAPVAEAGQLPGRDYDTEQAGTIGKMLYLFKSTFFQQLGLETLASIARDAEVRVYRRGGVVCLLGERSDRLFVICQGSADVCLPRNGGYRWIDAVGEGDSIGELGVFTRQPRSATVIANRDDTRLVGIRDRALLSVVNQNPEASMRFLKLVGTRHQSLLARM